jgi:N-acetylglucosamine-6-sulfatase
MTKIKKITVALLVVAILTTSCSVHLPRLRVPEPTATPQLSVQVTPKSDVTVLPKSDRPNIVLILADDLDAKMGTTDYMPYLSDLMVAQGISITDFVITNPLCCPSRSTILRGQYVHCHKVYTNAPPTGGFEKFNSQGLEASTMGTWLQAAGYRTAFLGKYLNGYPLPKDKAYVPPGWTEWYSPAKGKPYVGLHYDLNENGTIVPYDALTPENYLTDVLTRKSVDFIKRAAAEPEPFFVFLSPYGPHEPAVAAERHQNEFLDLQVPRTPSFDEADVSDKLSPTKDDPRLTEAEIQKLDEMYVHRVQTVQSVDEMLQQVVQALEETGTLDNTYIIFTSDNGYHLGQHRQLGGKSSPYEEDIIVPFVIRGPGIPAGKEVSNYLAGNTDIAPTVAELAGVVPPEYVDGRSMLPLFGDNVPALEDWRNAMLVEFYGVGNVKEESSTVHTIGLNTNVGYTNYPEPGLLEPLDWELQADETPMPNYLAIRTTQYLYVEYAEANETELYDLVVDPYELNNIASSASPELLNSLSNQLKAIANCSGNSCFQAEDGVSP